MIVGLLVIRNRIETGDIPCSRRLSTYGVISQKLQFVRLSANSAKPWLFLTFDRHLRLLLERNLGWEKFEASPGTRLTRISVETRKSILSERREKSSAINFFPDVWLETQRQD